jgi:hypothetical protein
MLRHRSILWFGVLFALTLPLVGLQPVPRASAMTVGAVNVTLDCQGFTGIGHITGDRENQLSPPNREIVSIIGTDGLGSEIYHIDWWFDGIPIGTDVIGDLVSWNDNAWTSTPQANPLTLTAVSAAGVDSSGNPVPEQSQVLGTGICPGLSHHGNVQQQTPVAGCEAEVNIPATAVGGLFTANAPLYWAPGKLVEPTMTIQAGKTALVIGPDASASYDEILWGCNFVWVPANTLAPNPDNVWHSAPLPTAVVQ